MSKLTIALVAAAVAGATPIAGVTTASGSEGRIPESFCYTNLQGLGICGFDESCEAIPSCDATTPCADGQVCVTNTGCGPDGICIGAPFYDGGCSNPGNADVGFEPCAPILFHEDFNPPPSPSPEAAPFDLHQMTVTGICGEGSGLFEEEACAASVGASSPLATARWGVAFDCAIYAPDGVAIYATTGPIDISGCAGAVLDFDYLFALQEGPSYDRGYVTVQVDSGFTEVVATNQIGAAQAFPGSAASCGGHAPGSTVLPVGTLVDDDAWHHFRAGIGSGATVEVRFWAETYDGTFNSGQGWFFDDVRVDCGLLVHRDGFEGRNLLRWSSSTAPPVLVEVYEVLGVCKDYVLCGGPDADCRNFKASDGKAYCLNDFSCANAACPGGQGDCAAGEICVVESCCASEGPEGVLGQVCVPAGCDPGPSMAAARGPSGARP